jgi:hypothetical protein
VLTKVALIYISPMVTPFDTITVSVIVSDQSSIDNFQRGHISATFWRPERIIEFDQGLRCQDGIAASN